MASRLGKRPQLLTLLKRLADYAFAEKKENYNALLNAYMSVKSGLSRPDRQKIVETLLVDEKTTARMIYEEALKADEKSLSGCRLFFAREHAIYKFWDTQDRPGLWQCFGPFQLHLSPQQVFSRVSLESGIAPADLLSQLNTLRVGISAEEFANWPAELSLVLQQNNMVATPGGQVAYLHPRIQIERILPVAETFASDTLSVAAMIIEKLWDTAEFIPEVIAQLPDFNEFNRMFAAESLPAVVWNNDFNVNEAFELLGQAFWQQQAKDNGQLSEGADESSSGPSVGMETADEEIDSEEGEHRDDEPCD